MDGLTQHPLIDHWSYSAMRTFLRNPLAFKKRYVLKQYDETFSPAGIVGQAAHKAIENFLKNGFDIEASVKVGLNHIDAQPDIAIDYGKTGSRAKMISDYTSAVGFWFAECPDWHARKILGVEDRIEAVIEVRGAKMAIPAKGYIDVVWEDNGEIKLTDHKFIRSYTDSAVEHPPYFLQAMFNYYLTFAKYGKFPTVMSFDEVKLSKNKDGSPQIQPYVIRFDEHPQFEVMFENLYNACTKEILREDAVFLPNIDDMFDGADTFLLYRQNVLTIDVPVVAHKTKEVDFVEKNYSQSSADRLGNKDLTEEERIRLKLQEFGLPVEMQKTYTGASVIQYTLKPSRGLKMSQFEKVAPDIALALKATSVRIQAPIYGTDTVGIEVSNPNRTFVAAEEAKPFLTPGTLTIPVGVNVYGDIVMKALDDMPHLLIAGATGSGKSVMINTIIHSLVYQNNEEQMKLVLIDPKRVELAQFKHLPHLLSKLIYDYEPAVLALNWLVDEMETRYKRLEDADARSIRDVVGMSPIVVVIDEFADLVLRKKKGESSEAEELIVRLAQKSRAVGIHIILGTQRPSTDVVTGLLKANLPTRIAFRTSSRVDSAVILDQGGAEALTGKGDLLFLDPAQHDLQRLQGLNS